MRHGSLFSGIGGFDLAAEWMGWENVFHCEKDEKCQRLLKKRFPNSESLGDITETDFKKYANRIDIITGGFPCQPYSVAGLQKGKEDERHLWPQMLRAIREISPSWVLGENVLGLVNWNGGLVFHEVQADLENEGYEVQPYILPACAVNAPHRRDRVWFIAYSNIEQRKRKIRGVFTEPENVSSTNPNISRWKECWPKWFTSREFAQDYGITSEPGIRRGNDGFSGRVDRLKQLGNAVVPQVVYQIFKAIEEYDRLSIP